MAMKAVRAYTLAAEVLAAEVIEIKNGGFGLSDDETAASLEAVQSIAERFAHRFEEDNPGFSRERFLADAKINDI